MIVLWFVPQTDRGGRPLSLDIRGALFAVGGLGGVIYALTAGPASGWLSAPVRGLGTGICVTPLTAAVLAAVADVDLGEASAVNDATARVGGVVVIALVPALIGATGGRSLSQALVHGYQPSMLVMTGLCVAAALVTGLFVSDSRPSAPAPPSSPRIHSAPLPIPHTVSQQGSQHV